MRPAGICFFIVFILFVHTNKTIAQFQAMHQIDSVMDLSPYYLPTHFTNLKFIEFEPLIYKPVDTGMVTTHQYDPLFKTENIYQHLGICGQAHQSMIFNYQKEMGFVYQTLPYPLFFKKQSALNFYKLQTTYSKIAYTFGLTKENELDAVFAKSMKGVTISAHVFGILNNGAFAHQKTTNICGDITIHYELPSTKYGFKASYIINRITNEDNGGLSDFNAYQSRVAKNNASYDVNFLNAKTQITEHDFTLQNYVNIKNKNNKYFGTIVYDFQLHQTKVDVKDKDMNKNRFRYENYYFSNVVTHDSTKIMTAKNAIQWSNFSPYQEKSNKNNFFHIAGGVLHDYADLKYSNTRFISLYLFARTQIHLFKVMDITAKVSYSIGDYTNEDLSAKAGISWTINKEKEHIIGLNAHYDKIAPDYKMQHLFTNNFRWANRFEKQNIVQFNTFWNYEKYNCSVSYYFINKWVYLSEELVPVQNKNNGNLIQISTFIPYRYKNFGATANLHLQYCSKDVVNVPLFAGKLSIYYIFELLKKKLKIQIGTDAMYNTTYYADVYLPVLQMFYSQQTHSAGNFVFLDANLTIKIERIIFFFRIGNLLPPIMKYRNYTTPYYPVNDFFMNLGICWRFHD